MKEFKKYRNAEKTVNLDESLSFLIDLLYTHFVRKVYLLIDDYDALINSSIGQIYY